MCVSLTGRLQTRLVALAVPALLAAILIALTGDQRYFTMFLIVAVVALDLELFLYHRVFGYQARWQTYLLGIVEFPIYLLIVYGLGGTLPVRTIVLYYLTGWIGGLLAVNFLLPLVDVTWMEHGGEIARGRIARPSAQTLLLGVLLLLIALQLTLIPGSLSFAQVATAGVTALALGWAARRLALSAPGPSESLVLGLSVTLLIRAPGVMPFALSAGLAILVRSWLHVARRPVFNGAAAAFVALVLFVPGVYAAEAQWGNSLLLPLVMANLGLLIGLRRKKLQFVLAFAAVFLAHGLLVTHARQDILQILLPSLLPASFVFFAGFVAPDDATIPNGAWAQIIVGGAVGVLGLTLQARGIGLPFAVALLALNYATSLARIAGGVMPRLHLPAFATLHPVRAPDARAAPPAREPHLAAPMSIEARAGSGVGPVTNRRVFLGSMGILGGSVFLGGAVNRLTGVDPAILSLPPEPALANGQAIPRFRDVAAESGIVMNHHGAPSEGSPAVGTGVAWGDFDNDGLPDLYVTDHLGPSHLYRNNGDGTFTDVAVAAGVAHPTTRTTSATFVDYDNDGWLDLYVGAAYGPNVLYHNNGDGMFTDVTTRSGLGDTGRTMSTAWADYNGDGYLDVFVANYSEQAITFNPNDTPGQNTRHVMRLPRPQSRLYHNNGDGTFTNVTPQLGYLPTEGLGFSAVWLDYNDDGRPDLYVVYDFGSVLQPSTLWRNDGPGGPTGWRFTEVESQMGVDTKMNPMGAASGDYDNDGWLDLAVSNIGPNLLYHNERGRGFREVAQQAHVTYHSQVIDNMLDPSMTWGVSFADFNNDGWLDLYMVAGPMDYEHVPQPNLLFLNDHSGRFIDVSAVSGTNDPGQGRSVAVADYDGDGSLDMFVANYGQPPLLYRNVGRSSANRWVRLKLEGTESNRSAVGARVTVFAHGMRPQTREVQIGQGLGSCDDTALHFGLGTAAEIELVRIRWPSGRKQTLRGVQFNRVVGVREPGPSRWPQRR